MNPLCLCALETENMDQFFLHRQNHASLRTALLKKISSTYSEIISLRPIALAEEILDGDKKLNDKLNRSTLSATINDIKNTQGFIKMDYFQCLKVILCSR